MHWGGKYWEETISYGTLTAGGEAERYFSKGRDKGGEETHDRESRYTQDLEQIVNDSKDFFYYF